MDFMSLKYGIIPQEIFGYSVINGNNHSNELYSLPGFRILNQHMQERNPQFSFWIKHSNLRRGGILKRFSRLQITKAPTASDEESEFDVVKKRRVMEAAPQTPSSDDTPAALDAFENFERCVLPALELIHKNDEQDRRKELEELEDSMAKGIILSTTGGVYFAWSECLRCMKIGATRRNSPSARLQELSRYVTVPFTLVGWIPTPTPFRLESLTHSHFAASRIRHTGAGTEFFNISAADVASYIAATSRAE